MFLYSCEGESMKKQHGDSLKARALRKLGYHTGESISETLIALLVAALALTMLAGALSSSANIINKGRDTLKEYYDANEEIVTMRATPKTDKTVTITDGSNFTQSSISIKYYTNENIGNTPTIIYKKTP